MYMNPMNKTKFNNYLLDLVDEKNKIGNSIYVYNSDQIIKNVWKEIIERKKKINVRELIPKKLDLEPTHLYSIIKGKRGISIQSLYKLLLLWKVFCNKSKVDVEEKWNQVYDICLLASFSKGEKTKLPKYLSPELSYLIGYVVGDGCFDSSGNHYRLKISETKKEQLESVLKPLVESIFSVNCIVKNEGSGRTNSNFLIINSKPVFRFFRNVLKIKVGEVPIIIKNSTETNKKQFIRVVFDAEGSVDPDYLRGRIRIFQKSKKFLEDMIEMIEDAEIFVNGPYGPHFKKPSKNFHYHSSWYSIEVRKKSEVLKFIQEIGSSHISKIIKMKKLEDEIKNRYK